MAVDSDTLIARMTSYMHDESRGRDASHDPAHTHRVVGLSRRIMLRERERRQLQAERLRAQPKDPGSKNSSRTEENVQPVDYDEITLELAALLHDVHDHKYATTSTTTASSTSSSSQETHKDHPLYAALLDHGCTPNRAEDVVIITSHISYSREIRTDPAETKRLLATHPELAVVQDADRLDALGAVGVGRCFVFTGARSGLQQSRSSDPETKADGTHVHGNSRRDGKEREGEGCALDDAVSHFREKLEKLEGLMKTETGREMAHVRTERLRMFRTWWDEEMAEAAAGSMC